MALDAVAASARIHPTAILAPGAVVGEGAEVGPFCIVGAEAVIGAGARLASHNVVEGRTEIGAGAKLSPFASVGLAPQDLKYKGEPTGVRLGARSELREHVTVHRGSVGGSGMTLVGEGCLLMACSHVGHDCVVGDGVILANNVMLGGHVRLGDNCFLGGGAAVHQTVRIGRQAMIGGLAGVTNDVPPFGNAFGLPARLVGLNVIGLRRRGYAREDLHALRAAFRLIYREPGTFAERLSQAEAQFAGQALVEEVIAFLRSAERKRELIRPGRMTAEFGAEDEEA
ncbi:acyl-ACP--UDP-N-acetylglucosamine O-acyltransferase [Roseococcus sp. DSY-14]|uniref:acyl-ACP--UDP-N-acetylglucosamine O-acyltransferase n=1 Tax=Roseococcus sp. DSY-14 TaxID=3369650 RepID=UPI00387AAD30